MYVCVCMCACVCVCWWTYTGQRSTWSHSQP